MSISTNPSGLIEASDIAYERHPESDFWRAVSDLLAKLHKNAQVIDADAGTPRWGEVMRIGDRLAAEILADDFTETAYQYGIDHRRSSIHTEDEDGDDDEIPRDRTMGVVIVRSGRHVVSATLDVDEEQWSTIVDLATAINRRSDQDQQPQILLAKPRDAYRVAMCAGALDWGSRELARASATRAQALRDAAAEIHNDAGDPEQEFYDRGVATWLLARADDEEASQ